jgi:hypothetical protein
MIGSILFLSPRTRSDDVFRKWFVKWHHILHKYENRYKGDLPYWCTERTNIGHLALAAYALSGYPLQEYSTQERRKGGKGLGRADLYVDFPRRSFNIECKQKFLIMDGNIEKTVNNVLERAEKDCRNLASKDQAGRKRIAMAFAVPRIKLAGANKESLNKFKTDLFKLEKQLNARFIAIHFADYKISKNASKKHRDKFGHFWYPGIAIICRWIN